MNATTEQHKRVVDYLNESGLSFSQIQAEEAEVDLVEWEEDEQEEMNLDTFVARFKIRNV